MTVPEISQTVTVTPTLTPIQEKAMFGVNLKAHFESVNYGLSDNILDSTLATLKKLEEGDTELMQSWIDTKHIHNEFDYSVLMVLLSKYQRNASDDAIDSINSIVLNRLASVNLKTLPSFSNLIAWNSLDDISTFLNNSTFKDCNNLEKFKHEFKSLMKKEISNSIFSYVLYYYFGFKFFQNSPKHLEKISLEFTDFFDNARTNFKFPTATHTNEQELDPLVKLAIHLVQMEKLRPYLDIYQISNKYIHITYQNVRVMKFWCLNSLHLGSLDETRATFRTYLNYVSDYKVKFHGKYYDIVGVIDTYIAVLKHLSNHMSSKEEYNEYNEWFKEVQDIMDIFIAVVGSNIDLYRGTLKSFVANVYLSFAKIYENFLNMKVKPFDEIGQIVLYLEKAANALNGCNHDDFELKIDSERISHIYYSYSFYLHKSGKHELSRKYCKHALVHSPNDIKYITYFVKLLSGDEEEVDEALLVSQQLIEHLHKNVNEEDAMKWTLKKKADALEAYLVFLTLLKESAIDALPPFFGYVNKLFGSRPILGEDGTINKNNAKNGEMKNINNRVGKMKLNDRSDELCTPCTPNSYGNSNNSINTTKERRLKSLLHLGKKNDNQEYNSNKKIGQSIRKSLQVNRLNTKVHQRGHSISSTNSGGNINNSSQTQGLSKSTNYGSLTPGEITLLRMMWLTLSRIFQNLGDIETSLQCVEEADGYCVTSMMVSSSGREVYLSKGISEEKIHRVAVLARRGCVLATAAGTGESVERVERGRECLLEAVGVVESCGGVRGWPAGEIEAAAEAVVGLAQVAVAGECLARCRKHLEAVAGRVAFGDCARVWLVLGAVCDRGGGGGGVAGAAGAENVAVLRGVHGWHGLAVLR